MFFSKALIFLQEIMEQEKKNPDPPKPVAMVYICGGKLIIFSECCDLVASLYIMQSYKNAYNLPNCYFSLL